jgi:hypothetical protein
MFYHASRFYIQCDNEFTTCLSATMLNDNGTQNGFKCWGNLVIHQL